MIFKLFIFILIRLQLGEGLLGDRLLGSGLLGSRLLNVSSDCLPRQPVFIRLDHYLQLQLILADTLQACLQTCDLRSSIFVFPVSTLTFIGATFFIRLINVGQGGRAVILFKGL